jgi:hypothetical protein
MMSNEMKIDPTRAKDLVGALQSVSQRIAKSAGGRNVSHMTYFLLEISGRPTNDPRKHWSHVVESDVNNSVGEIGSSVETQASV